MNSKSIVTSCHAIFTIHVLLLVILVCLFGRHQVTYTPISYRPTTFPIGNSFLEFNLVDCALWQPGFALEDNSAESSSWSEPAVVRILEPTVEIEPLEGKDLYISYVVEICNKYYNMVDPYIVVALIDAETGGTYDPNLESSCNAVGLMQVIPKYHAKRAEKYGLYDIWDPYTNIIAGVDFLNDLYEDTGNWSDALYGYNHSRSYVNYVLAKAESFRKDGILG